MLPMLAVGVEGTAWGLGPGAAAGSCVRGLGRAGVAAKTCTQPERHAVSNSSCMGYQGSVAAPQNSAGIKERIRDDIQHVMCAAPLTWTMLFSVTQTNCMPGIRLRIDTCATHAPMKSACGA